MQAELEEMRARIKLSADAEKLIHDFRMQLDEKNSKIEEL